VPWAGGLDVPTSCVEEREMRVQIEHKRRTRRGDGDEASDDSAQDRTPVRTERLREEIDEILDEIDSVLEQNAEQFVTNYIQKGGE
jgi:prokaryotic ubiquitin-like protein Pup